MAEGGLCLLSRISQVLRRKKKEFETLRAKVVHEVKFHLVVTEIRRDQDDNN